MSRLLRRPTVCLGVLAVLGLALLPAEHVHSRASNGRHSEVVHRHAEPHHPVHAAPNEVSSDHDDDENARYLSSAFTSPKPPAHINPVGQFVLVDLPVPALPALSWSPLPATDLRDHDPPWATSAGLRAPPTLLV